MYRVYLNNFQRYLDFLSDSCNDAMDKAISAGFESTIYRGDEPIMEWSPIYGWRNM